ncbi:MAG: HprK-related kinase A [Gammaproteobacteria bacterium]
MIINDFSERALRTVLNSDGICFRAGRFSVNLSANIPRIAKELLNLYGESEVLSGPCDFNVQLQRTAGLRYIIKPQVQFIFNGVQPFSPLPLDQAYPLLEWGLNWCVTNHCHQYLIIHAAVVEKNGFALILPGQPGSGKSTLCAALVERGGWRLLSDELTMLQLDDQLVVPNPRPVSLKNQSINLVKSITSSEKFSPVVKDTIKGSVAHLRPPQSSVKQYDICAKPVLVVYPKFVKGVDSYIQELSKGQSFIRLADHCFNYSILGLDGFRAMSGLHDQVTCYDYCYDGNLDEALPLMDSLLPA